MTIDAQTIDAAYDSFLAAEEAYIDACNQMKLLPSDEVIKAAYNAAEINFEDARIVLFDARNDVVDQGD
tara:strand:+ start:129 stop:335 length:207 start_codon:yes stop_codon:yes gene_type:complete